jgi:ketosteroid isomerase-like protein
MSQENVEIARGVFHAWKAGDMEAVRDLYDPDVIVRGLEGWPEPGPFVGREAVMRQWEQQRETWDADIVEPIGDFFDAADRVVVRQAWRGAGHGPGLNMEKYGDDERLDGAEGQDRLPGVLLGSRGGPRNSRAVGVGHVGGER